MKNLKKLLKIAIFGLVSAQSYAQSKTLTKPKLVVGIVVDQMRYDYLYKYYAKYGDGGFKRLMSQGFNCRNNQYHYAATYTGPGHAHIFNGSAPALSGIIGNEWYDRNLNRSVYVAEDSTAKVVGPPDAAAAGKMSPRNMLVTSICDQLRISNQFQSKVYGVAFKDRGAIMPAGHTANAAFWFDTKSGQWISSDYYLKTLPAWVESYNATKPAHAFVGKTWNTLLPIEQYTESEADQQNYEGAIAGESKSVFPHEVKGLGTLPQTPFGNTLTKDFALKLIESEKLGKGAHTDFLTLSFSSPDYVGHAFGAASIEVEDVYLRLDADLAEILNTLDKTLGKNTYTVFLSADHGVADIPAFLKKNKVPAGLYIGAELRNQIDKIFSAKLGEGKWLSGDDNYQFYLNKATLAQYKMSVDDVLAKVKDDILALEGVYNVFKLDNPNGYMMPQPLEEKIKNVYNPRRSGDFMVILQPAWFTGYGKGTTHGSLWPYDTHVPLLFYGWGIPKGETTRKTQICDIAPTIAMLLKILEPNGTVGQPISEIFNR